MLSKMPPENAVLEDGEPPGTAFQAAEGGVQKRPEMESVLLRNVLNLDH